VAFSRVMVLLGYDGSDDAARAIVAASELMDGHALVVHVWEPVPAGAAPAVASPGLGDAGLARLHEAEQQIEDEARDVLEQGAQLAAESGFEVESMLVRGAGGTAWRDVLDVAKARDVRVVVVGRRGVSRLHSALLGSVSNGLVQHAHVPVLVVPPLPR
jgi:nucleotide-binding universal stress UspA family protein